ncbi:hypothetical protein C9374_008746 [Naegleria lovaniensis]|uniref:RING-type domain-containing protein n=1 Tax=Naegleria lovaniensis TaxID=51637 RepID=A0AA88GIJ0_NAELO|nr:uncharacterized protein C9374_008746 [Naegleria lovaniensis]KAG2378124.1 hypothetical protein C9374_008746 [Naegleria lovaniensis]
MSGFNFNPKPTTNSNSSDPKSSPFLTFGSSPFNFNLPSSNTPPSGASSSDEKKTFFTLNSSNNSTDHFPEIHKEIERLSKLIQSAESSNKSNSEELQKLKKENEKLKEEIEMSKSALSKSKLLPDDLQVVTLDTIRQIKLNLIESQKLVLEREMELVESDNFCSCCLASKKTVVFLPCCHLCTCEKCSLKLTACPLCRKNIEKSIYTHN